MKLKDFIPILAAILSAIMAYVFGRFNEKNKTYIEISNKNLNQILTKMYKEVVDITNVNNYNVKKIKKFIIKYSSNECLNILFDDEIIFELYDLSIKIRTGSISNNDLKDRFYKFSLKIENLYWDLFKASSNNFKWWIKKKTRNKWYGFLGSLTILFKESFEYLSIALTLFTGFIIADKISNGKNAVIPSDIAAFVFIITFLIGATFILFLAIYTLFFSHKEIKRRKLVKKN